MNSPESLYLRLLKRCLTRLLFPDSCVNIALVPTGKFDTQARTNGEDWPADADTMVGLKRLDNVESCIINVLNERVPGDLVETGVWRGGVSILMRAVLNAYGDAERCVWLADSFRGLPEPDTEKYPADAGDPLSRFSSYLGVSLEQVRSNFEKYELLDDRVRFLPGWVS